MRRAAPCVLACLFLAPPAGAAPSAGQTESQLQAIREQIHKVTQQIGRDAAEKDRLAKALRAAELSMSEKGTALQRLQGELGARQSRRGELASQRSAEQAALARQRADLAAQLRAAYLIGPQEPVRLLLNQQDPLQSGRLLMDYGYFARARRAQIEAIHVHLARIEALDVAVAGEQSQLQALQASEQAELSQLQQARDQRQRVLAELKHESSSHEQQLSRLTSEQAGLEKLLRELRRALSPTPLDNTTAFGRLRGQLDWPLTGTLRAGFGDRRAGGVRWEGVVIGAPHDAPVHAVSAGRVVYADWLPGLGLLSIVDHGESYLSLYGFNSRLYHNVGDRVAAGEVIAAAGDTGGRSQPELYFEIRHNGRPVDPSGWFRRARPE